MREACRAGRLARNDAVTLAPFESEKLLEVLTDERPPVGGFSHTRTCADLGLLERQLCVPPKRVTGVLLAIHIPLLSFQRSFSCSGVSGTGV